MARQRTSNQTAWLRMAIAGGAVVAITGAQAVGYAMGWLEKKVKEHEDRPWKNLDAAMPLVKQRADRLLVQLGYEPAKLAFDIVAAGVGEEVWTVKYWSNPPKEFVDQVAHPAEVEVYLNNRGQVKRVMKYDGQQKQLLYGKDERIVNGMTPAQVREQLGEPDLIGPPPRGIKHEIADQMWKYNANQTRTMTIQVYFKEGKVSSASYFGK